MKEKEPWYTSIAAIVIALIFFWPIGCVFLCLRLGRNGNKYKTTNTFLLIGAIVLIFIGIVGMSTFFETFNMSDFWLALLMFLLPGGLCAYFWFRRKKKFKDYKIYLDYINARKKVKLDNLAQKLNVSLDTAVDTLTEMISKGLINGYLTDDALIINGISSDVVNDEPVVPKETKVVKCKECGAKNTVIVGQTKECEYCGTVLQ